MIKLGDKVTDVISGYKGIAWSRLEYLTSPPQIGIMAQSDNNKVPEVYYVDEDRCVATSVYQLQEIKYSDAIKPSAPVEETP